MSEPLPELDRSDIIIRRADGIIFAAIPQYGLFAQGPTIQAAVAALDEKKSALQAELAAFSALGNGSAAQMGRQSIRWGEIKQFAVKTAIVFVVVLATLMYSAVKIDELAQNAFYRVQMELKRAGLLDSRTALKNVERALEDAAGPAQELPEERKQKILSNIRVVADRWRPFLTEASAMFTPKTQATESPRDPP